METIYHQVWIQSDPKNIFDAITTREGLDAWWGPALNGEPKLNYTVEFNHDNEIMKMKIIEIEPNRLLVWEYQTREGDHVNHDFEWDGHIMRFELVDKGNFVDLKFTHTGWDCQSEFYGICNYHWGRALEKLKYYCETGQSSLDLEHEKKEHDAVLRGKV